MPITKKAPKRRVTFQTPVEEEVAVEAAPPVSEPQQAAPASLPPIAHPLTPAAVTTVPPESVGEPTEDMHMEEDQKEGISNVKLFFLIAGIVALVALLLGGGGYYLYTLGLQHGQEKARVETTQKPTTSSGTVTPIIGNSVDKKEHGIIVLNGSGIAGEAGNVKTALEDEGYVVDTIGNAETDDNSRTIIQTNDSVSAGWIAQLKKFLEKTYKRVATAELQTDESSDVVLILGNQKK